MPAEALENTRHLHISSFFLQKALQPGCADLFRRARERGLTTSLDTGDDPDDVWDSGLAAVLAQVDVFFPNRREATRITGTTQPIAALERLAPAVANVVVKLGGDGAIASIQGKRLQVGSYPVPAGQYTTGAGDAFDAGFLRAHLRGMPVEECLRWAAAAGALATTWLGGHNSQLTEDAVRRLVERERVRVAVVPLA